MTDRTHQKTNHCVSREPTPMIEQSRRESARWLRRIETEREQQWPAHHGTMQTPSDAEQDCAPKLHYELSERPITSFRSA